jgi:uncharacterized protein (DUF2164 family)
MSHVAFMVYFHQGLGISQIDSLERQFVINLFARVLGNHFYQPCLSVVEKYASAKIEEMSKSNIGGQSCFTNDVFYNIGDFVYKYSKIHIHHIKAGDEEKR